MLELTLRICLPKLKQNVIICLSLGTVWVRGETRWSAPLFYPPPSIRSLGTPGL